MSGGVGSLVASGPLIIAVPVALAAGAVTFLSPCCLPLVPGYLSYVTGMSGAEASPGGAGRGGAVRTGQAAGSAAPGGPAAASAAGGGPAGGGAAGGGPAGGGSVATATLVAADQAPGRARVVAGVALFVLGFSALFASYGVLFGGLGAALLAHQEVVTRILGGVTIALGLMFAGVFDRFALTGRIVRPSMRPRAGLAGAPLLGVMFGLTWTPCVGPTLSAVLLMASTSGTAARGALLAFVYGIGIGVPFLIVAFAFQRGMNIFGFARRHARLITGIGGAMLVIVGVLEVTGTWATAMTWLRVHWISGYQSPL
jgi:cytochrome c-type biogenesis protein